MNAKPLPATGTYTSLTLYDVSADATGTLTIGGAPASGSITTPGWLLRPWPVPI